MSETNKPKNVISTLSGFTVDIATLLRKMEIRNMKLTVVFLEDS